MIPDKDLAFKLGQAKIHDCSAMWVLPDGRLRVRNLIYSVAEYRSDPIMGRGWTEYVGRFTLEEVDVEGSAMIGIMSQMNREGMGKGNPKVARAVPKEFHYCQGCKRLKKDGKEIPYARQGTCYDTPFRRPSKPRKLATYWQCEGCSAEKVADEKREKDRRAKEEADPSYDPNKHAIPLRTITPGTFKYELLELKPMEAPKLSALFPLAQKGDFFDYVVPGTKKIAGRGLRRGFVGHFYEYDPDHKDPQVALCGLVLTAPNSIDRADDVFNRSGGRIKTADCGVCYMKKRAALVESQKSALSKQSNDKTGKSQA